MAAEIRATGLSEEQATAYLDELQARGFAGAASTPHESEDEQEAGRVLVDVRIGLDGKTDAASLSKWLDDQGIAHAIVQDGGEA